MKQYEFKVHVQFPDGAKSIYHYNASTEREARNKCKATFHTAKIIACVRGHEIKLQDDVPPKKAKESESSGSGLALGIAGAVGGFILSKLFSSSK